jgi:hypothetical protein
MKTPMILPWLASRAGVSDHRAAALWRVACRQAALLTGERDSSRYWGATQQILLNRLAMQRWQSVPPIAWPRLVVQDSLEYWSRLARHWLLLPLYRPMPAGRAQ